MKASVTQWISPLEQQVQNLDRQLATTHAGESEELLDLPFAPGCRWRSLGSRTAESGLSHAVGF